MKSEKSENSPGGSRPVTRRRIASGLERLGLGAGDTVMVHSSLSSFGLVEGGAETVVRALLEVIGDRGTLVVPTFSRYLQGGEDYWDREKTPSLMGVISETVRTWPGALRSSHAAHPLSALGARAAELCRKPYRTGFGPDSPFMDLVRMNAAILLAGVSWNSCTIMHLLEAAAGVPYRFLEARRATVVIDGVRRENAAAWEYTREKGTSYDFRPLGRLLAKNGLVAVSTVGRARLTMFRAGPMYELGMAEMKKDILFLKDRKNDHRSV